MAIDLGFTSSEFAGRLRKAVNDLVSTSAVTCALFEEFRASYVLHFVPRGVDPGGVHTRQVM